MSKPHRKNLCREYKDWMPEAFWKHIYDGWSMGCFASRHSISQPVWNEILRTHPRIQIIREQYLVMKKQKHKCADAQGEYV